MSVEWSGRDAQVLLNNEQEDEECDATKMIVVQVMTKNMFL
jgi:hypothetical protein